MALSIFVQVVLFQIGRFSVLVEFTLLVLFPKMKDIHKYIDVYEKFQYY